MVVKVNEDAVDIVHAGMIKTADCYRVHDAPVSRTIVDGEPKPLHENATEHSSTGEQQERTDAGDGDGQFQSVEISHRNRKKLTREVRNRPRQASRLWKIYQKLGIPFNDIRTTLARSQIQQRRPMSMKLCQKKKNQLHITRRRGLGHVVRHTFVSVSV